MHALIDVAHLAQDLIGRELPGMMRSSPRFPRETVGSA
jgi:hypothetical protein